MLQNLFVVPYEVGGVRLFGFGWLLAVWAVASVAVLLFTVRRHGWGAEARGFLPVMLFVAAAIWVLPRVFPTGLPVRGYGVMMLLGVVSGVGLAMHRARRVGVNPELILSLALWMFVSGIVGARVFYVVEYWADFRRENATLGELLFAVLNISQGGLVVYGSFIAVMIAIALFVYRHRLPALALLDLIAPCMLLGLALGRVGCMFNGCCFGGQCDLPWAVEFPWGSPPHVRQVEQGLVDLHGLRFATDKAAPPIVVEVLAGSAAERAGVHAGDRLLHVSGRIRDYGRSGRVEELTVRDDTPTVADARTMLLKVRGEGATLSLVVSPRGNANPAASTEYSWTLGPSPRSLAVHPTQIYSAIDAALICFLLLAYAPFQRRDGEIIGLMLVIYPITRFLEESVRTDEPYIGITRLTISQIISLFVLAAGVVLWSVILTRPAKMAFRKDKDFKTEPPPWEPGQTRFNRAEAAHRMR